ncbi:siderophore-interacting protein [Streptomyces harbinensis]|uniref:siderophore-interacting protein n=1 Tax=Streptomyces harbinensis TaxID=1176198 RepID=UPI0037174023
MTAAPFEFFDLQVLRTTRISPSFTRVTLGGDTLHRFASGGRDQRFKLFLPQPGCREVAIPRDAGHAWWPAWQRMDPAERGIMRTYTAREQRRGPDELDIDFALHGEQGGPASRWAEQAAPGDAVAVLGPLEEDNAAVDFRPPPEADWMLITGDETALPAVAGILDWLPPGIRAKVWLEVAHPDDRQELATEADADSTWIIRDRAGATLLESVRATHLPAGRPYAWIAGEAGSVRTLRRHLVNDRGIDRKNIKFTGYWRKGTTEDDLIAQIATDTAPATSKGNSNSNDTAGETAGAARAGATA